MTPTDDLGTSFDLTAPVSRVVSLVPSLTEAIAASRPELLIAATDWCTHPAELEVARVRGTKNPDLKRILELAPDLVVCNQEENRELDVRRLRAAGVPVWVTRIRTLAEAFSSMRRLFTEALAGEIPDWLETAEEVWQPAPRRPATTAATAIWRDPWMVVGGDTFTGDLLARLGVGNVFRDSDQRYPQTTPAAILAAAPDVVLLPDEPYVFTANDGPEAFPGLPTVLVSGRLLTWYGPSLVIARAELETALNR
jgi:ABC-type Fe3+-hydroxamate transport system substrate-binding protein